MVGLRLEKVFNFLKGNNKNFKIFKGCALHAFFLLFFCPITILFILKGLNNELN